MVYAVYAVINIRFSPERNEDVSWDALRVPGIYAAHSLEIVFRLYHTIRRHISAGSNMHNKNHLNWKGERIPLPTEPQLDFYKGS
jgi:hypothetical protein